MSFICDKCHRAVNNQKPFQIRHYRPKAYEARTYVRPGTHEIVYDPGGSGREIASVQVVCPRCYHCHYREDPIS